MNLLRTADGDIPGTGKVYDYNFNLGKILQSMTDSPEFDFISLVVSTDIRHISFIDSNKGRFSA